MNETIVIFIFCVLICNYAYVCANWQEKNAKNKNGLLTKVYSIYIMTENMTESIISISVNCLKGGYHYARQV